MTEAAARRRLPTLPGLIAGALVILGVLLWMFVSKGLLFLAGLGAFGPGFLRELGWLRDHDEFQRAAAHRAGYHAYLIGGLLTVTLASALGWREGRIPDAAEWLRLILIVLWLTWLFSALSAYWGARKTASRVLLTFGSFWALFVIAELVGDFQLPRNAHDFWMGLLGLGAGVMFVGPFFLLAWSAGRWPRRTGIILLGVAAVFAVITAPRGGLRWSTVLLTDALLLVPLIGSGIALLREAADSEEGGELRRSPC